MEVYKELVFGLRHSQSWGTHQSILPYIFKIQLPAITRAYILLVLLLASVFMIFAELFFFNLFFCVKYCGLYPPELVWMILSENIKYGSIKLENVMIFSDTGRRTGLTCTICLHSNETTNQTVMFRYQLQQNNTNKLQHNMTFRCMLRTKIYIMLFKIIVYSLNSLFCHQIPLFRCHMTFGRWSTQHANLWKWDVKTKW